MKGGEELETGAGRVRPYRERSGHLGGRREMTSVCAPVSSPRVVAGEVQDPGRRTRIRNEESRATRKTYRTWGATACEGEIGHEV